MKIKKIIMLMLICLFACLNTIYAQASQISCSAQIEGQNVSINGQIPNVIQPKMVTLLVGTPENIIYIDQKVSDASGNFNFNFPLSKNIAPGNYDLRVGSNSEALMYIGTLNYISSSVDVRNKFIEADVTVDISGYVPTITGTISCTESKTINFNIVNKTDNTVVADETITSENGIFNLSYTLPTLLIPKEYELTFSCIENNRTLTDMVVVIDSSTLLLELSGAVSTAENVDVAAQLQSVNTGLIDKETSFTGTDSVSVTIPNILSSATFNLSAQGYETVPENDYSIYTLYLNTGEESIVLAKVNNISAISEKVYELTYNSTKVVPVIPYGIDSENLSGTVRNNGTEILSLEDGRIVFRIVDIPSSEGKYRSGTINIFRFKNISDAIVSADIIFSEL